MKLLDSLSISGGNLVRLKLRTALTISGVVIAIGTFVSMLSFGAGNQKYVEDQFEKLGLFNTVQVYPREASVEKDSLPPRPLDRAAMEELGKIPGVRLAYPYDAFSGTVTFGDSTFETRAQAISLQALQTRFFSGLRAGHLLTSDSTKEVVVTDHFIREAGMTVPDSAIGKQVVILVKMLSVDSGIAKVLPPIAPTFRNDLVRSSLILSGPGYMSNGSFAPNLTPRWQISSTDISIARTSLPKPSPWLVSSMRRPPAEKHGLADCWRSNRTASLRGRFWQRPC